MIYIKVERDDIYITTQDGVLFEMNWTQMEDLEKALPALRKVEQAAPFDKLELSLP